MFEGVKRIVFKDPYIIKIMTKVKYVCKECSKESWFKVNLETYIITVNDLVCDDCNPIDDTTN